MGQFGGCATSSEVALKSFERVLSLELRSSRMPRPESGSPVDVAPRFGRLLRTAVGVPGNKVSASLVQQTSSRRLRWRSWTIQQFQTDNIPLFWTLPSRCGSHTTRAPPRPQRQHASSRPSTSGPTSTARQSICPSQTHVSSSSRISSSYWHAASCTRSNACSMDLYDPSRSSS
jgi:hypothetical protein